jgi:hypothetical protein
MSRPRGATDSSEAMQKKAPDSPKPVPTAIDFSAYRIANPEEFGRNMLRLLEEGSRCCAFFLE